MPCESFDGERCWLEEWNDYFEQSAAPCADCPVPPRREFTMRINDAYRRGRLMMPEKAAVQ